MCFGSRLIWECVAVGLQAAIDLNSNCDITGAKQSCLLHVCGSKFPKTTIRYLARMGFPSAFFLMVDIAMLGRALPVIGRRIWYSFSVMYSHVFVYSVRPKYS